MKKWQIPLRRMLALLLCVASLLGMFPALTLVTNAAAGTITADTVITQPAVPDVSDKFILTPLTNVSQFLNQDIVAIENPAGNVLMSCESTLSAIKKTTGKIDKSASGNELNKYYIDSSGNLHIDQTLRDDALWINMQNVGDTGYTATTAKPAPDVLKEMYYFSKGKTLSITQSGTTYKFENLFGVDVIFGNFFQKGKTGTWDQSFWNNNSTDDLRTHLALRWASSDNTPFTKAGSTSDPGTFRPSVQEWWARACSQIAVRSDGTCIIYFYNRSATSLRVLHYDDATQTWGTKYYDGNSGAGNWGTWHEYVSSQSDAVSKILADSGNIHKLYKYTESGKKQVQVTGKSVYHVGLGSTDTQVKDAISQNITVYDPDNGNLHVPYDGAQSTGCSYYIKLPDNFKTTTVTEFDATIWYHNYDGDTKVGTVKVYIEDISGAAFSGIASEGWVTRTNAGLTPVYAAATGSTLATFKEGSTVVNITQDMLRHSDGTKVTSKAAGTYSGLWLVYNNEIISKNFTLHVSDTTLVSDQPIYPQAGGVAVGKSASNIKTANEITTADIELIAKAASSTRGVDLVVIMDLSSSMKYSLTENNDDHISDTNPSRLTVMKTALRNLIRKMQADSLDVRIAMADFGDLDHYEFEDAVIHAQYRAWPQIEMYGGKKGTSYGGVNTNSTFYEVNSNNEISNQLNFILAKDDKKIGGYASQPFYLHPYKYDQNTTGFTGKLLPKIYTGSGKVNADAFVDVEVLTETAMSSIISQIDVQVGNLLGTNYDVGLEYAYRLAYARQQANIANGENRVVSCIFISDGAAMQYNYFSGRSQTEGWSQYLIGNTDEILTNYKDAPKFNLKETASETGDPTVANVHPALKWVLQRLVKMLHEGHLWVADHDSQSPNKTNTSKQEIGQKWSTLTYEEEPVYWPGNGWDGTVGSANACCGSAVTNGKYNFRDCFYGHNSGYSIDWYDLMEIIDDNKTNPALYAAPNPFGTTSGRFNVERLIQFLREPSYKVLNNNTFIPNSSNTWTEDDGKVTSGTNTLLNNDRYLYQTYSPYWYFYNKDGKNWWAEAMKGDTDKVYPVINRHAAKTTAEDKWQGDLYLGEVYNEFDGDTAPDYMRGKNYISGFKGLGMDIYTIGFAITANDNRISKEEAITVLKAIASSDSCFYDAGSEEALTNALHDIVASATSSASGAYFLDTMGAKYDLDMSVTTNGKPAITITQYAVNNSGVRTGTGTVKETITFAKVDGKTVVYSSLIKDGEGNSANILGDDGLIRGNLVIYNTNSTAVALENNVSLPGESFYWNLTYLPDGAEMAMVYGVTRDDSDLPNVTQNYPTNTSATLYFTDYLGNKAQKDTVSPTVSGYSNAQTRYQFYLVNNAGQPVNANGSTNNVNHLTAKPIGNTVTVDVAKGGQLKGNVSGSTATLKTTVGDAMSAAGISSNVYEAYETSAYYQVASSTTGQSHTLSKIGNTTKYTNDTVAGLKNGDLFANVVYFAVKLKERAKPDTVVVDYGLPVSIDLLTNDDNLTGATIEGFVKPSALGTAVSAPAPALSTKPTLSTSVADTYASISISNKKALWEPKTMQLSNYYQFAYTASADGYFYSSTVTVIPATSIYYEDSFVQYNQGKLTNLTWATWSTVGTAISGTQNQDRPGTQASGIDVGKIYGYDDAYANTTTYSGAAQKTTVTAENPARAVFSFYGTGFDIISYTNSNSGAVRVAIYKGSVTDFDDPGTTVDYSKPKYATNADGSIVMDAYQNKKYADGCGLEGYEPYKNLLVNTYYSAGDLWQVPIIKVDGLEYGMYTVELMVGYDNWFDVGQYGSEDKFDFYLDAIRIYNPAGIFTGNETDKTIQNAHKEDGEGWPRYQELRNMILAPEAVNGDVTSTKDISGMLFIDSSNLTGDKKATYAQYASWGPNNEVYLKNGQTVAFKLNELKYKSEAFGSADLGTVNKIHISMRGLGDKSQVKLYDGKNLMYTYDVSANDQYFDITNLKNKDVRIQVSGSTPVALTNIKVTHSSMPSDYLVEMGQSRSAGAAVMTSNTLQMNAPSMASLITVNGAMAAELLDELNKDLAAPAVLTPKYASLSFKDLIHTNIYFDADKLSGINTEDLGLAVFADNDVDGTVDTASYVVNGATLVDGMYKVSTQGIPAKNLGDTIYFKIFAREADGSYTYSNLLPYSPLEYANFLITSGSDMDKTLAAAMLNYGAEAQKYFGYKTDALMNATVTDEAQALLAGYSIDDLDALAAIDPAKAGAFTANGGFDEKYPSVSFKGAFQINYYFTPSDQFDGDVTFYYWTEDTSNAVTELTADNADGTVVMTADNGVYSAISGPIYAKQLDKTVYAAAVYESDGVTYCTGILPYSVAEYARAFADGTDDFAPFANAIGIYGSVAKAYFGN